MPALEGHALASPAAVLDRLEAHAATLLLLQGLQFPSEALSLVVDHRGRRSRGARACGGGRGPAVAVAHATLLLMWAPASPARSAAANTNDRQRGHLRS